MTGTVESISETGAAPQAAARRRPRRLASALLGSVSVAAVLGLPAAAQVAAVGGSGTTVSGTPTAVTVETSNIRGGTAYNQFSQFDVASGTTVDLYQPVTASALVNIIRSGGPSTIAGTVNAQLGVPGASVIGGNVYFVNSDGFVVTSSGVMNAGHLTLSTPSSGFVDDLTAEANGDPVLGNPTATLFAGGEPLSANGEINLQGQINATRLDMRAGLRMIVDGRITVNTNTSTGRIDPAVNIEGVPTAGGVEIGAGGVIRLVSGGSMQLRGNVSAKGSTLGLVDHGGLVEGIAEGEMTLGGEIDVSNGAGDAGSVMIFTRGSAVMEPALSVTASSAGGAGGFFALRAVGDVTAAQGDITTGPGGESFILGENVTVGGDITTGGGSIALRGARAVTVSENARISTRAGDAADPFLGAPGSGAAGDLLIAAREIDVQQGAILRADSDSADGGGFLGLIARNTNTGIAWAINPETEVAKVTITGAELTGGTVVVSAVAKASNSLGAIDESVEATQVEELEAATTEEQFEQMLDDTLLAVTQVFERGLTTLNGLVPVQVQVLTADASVTITDSQITANGNWDPISSSVQNETPEFADNGFLLSEGLREDEYEFLAASSWLDALLGDNAYQMRVSLPSVFDGESDSLLIHSHAETALSISPFAYGLGVSVAATDTRSQVSLSDSALATDAGNVRLASTATENHLVNIAAKKIANGAAAVAVSVRDLANQLVVDGGSITSAGRLDAGAFTGRNLSTSTIANSGAEGRLAVAVVVDISEGLTEAALGGTVNTGDAVDVGAETLFFDVSHVTTATMGLANVQRAINNHRNNNNGVTNFANSLRNSSSGSTPDPNRKPHFGLGVAVNVQLSNDTTNATIGGSYHDFDDSSVTLALGPTSITAPGSAVSVNAAYRFADRGSEGGGGFSRSTSAAFGKLTQALQYMVARHNAQYPNDQLTEDELLGRYSDALMLNVSVSSMVGDTTAEIGANATVTAGSLDVNALTRYPNTNPVQSLVNQWDTYVDQVTEYSPVADAGASNPPEPAPPPAPDLAGFIDIVNPLTYLTTDSKAKGEAPVAGDRVVVPGEEQGLAIGVTLTYFNTDNGTDAVIRDGATVVLDTAASVTALQESVFLHVTNLPKKNPLGGSAKVNDAIGGGIHFGRTVSDVRAEVESGATVTVNSGDLDVTATTRNIVASLAYSGGQGSDVAVNASIAAQVSEADTVARIGEAAIVTAEDVRVTATDNSVTWTSAGAVSGSENVGVGASGVFNFNSRRVWAGIGPADREAALEAASGTVIDASSLTILAENNATDIAVGVAGTKVVGKADPPADQAPPPNDDDDDMIIPTWLFDEDENDAASSQQNVSTPPDQEGAQQQSGWAVSGAAVLNLTLASETSAEILSVNRIDLSGDLTVTARSNAVAINVGGAVSAGLGAEKDTNALAGAFAIHVEDRKLRSRIVGAEINTGGNVTVKAEDIATVVNIAVGGAGTSRGDIALAGSVAWAQLGGGTTVELLDAEVTSAGLTLDADDTSTTVSVGGAVGINMDATQGYGVGVGVAVNNVNRSALAQVSGAGSVTTGGFSVTADSTQGIYAFATSAGVGKTGLAGSISVNTITGGAKAIVAGEAAAKFGVSADSVLVDAFENNTIFSLGGALAGGRSTAVGAAITVNVVTAGTEARLDHAEVSANAGDLGTVTLDSDSTSTITTIAVAGAAAIDGDAAGVGLSINEITAGTLASLEGSTVTDAEAILATADGARTIRSLGGGAAFSGRGAAGVAATVNLLLANDTKVVLDAAKLSTRDGGALTATATAGGEIASLAAGISASQSTSIGGAITVNVTTGTTGVSASGAELAADGALSLTASDTATISSLAGGAALSLGGNGVGGAVAANFIAHDTNVLANGGSLTGEGITLGASNGARIDSMAVGLAGGSSNAFSGSIAIGDIGNTTRAQAANSTLDGGTGALAISAARTGEINILSGSAAVGGSNAVGAALTVATLHGGVTADLVTDQPVIGSALSVTASRTGTIDALAVSGAVGAGGAGGAGSLVYTQIGRPGDNAPSVDPLPGGDPGEDPLGEGQAAVASARDGAITDLGAALTGPTALSTSDLELALDTDDVLRARVELAGTAPELPALTLTTTDTAEIRSLAGAVGVGVSSAGFGAGISVNLLFGKAEAELVLPAGEITTVNGGVNLGVTQTGSIATAGVAGGGGGAVGGAGSITVNVMNRQASARIAGAAADDATALQTDGEDVALSVSQGGTISSLAGAVGIGGNAGFGGAISVNVMSDDAFATVEDTALALASSTADPAAPLFGAGSLSVSTLQSMTLESLAAAVAGSGAGGAFSGSIAVNVADGEVGSTLRRASVSADAVTVEASATPTLSGIAGAISGSATAAVGVGIVTNVTRQTVRADADSVTIRARDAVQVLASSIGQMSGNAVAGAGSGTAAVTGSGIGNSAENIVEALVRDTDEVIVGVDAGSDIATLGSVLVHASGSNTIGLSTGTDEAPGLNVSFTGGGVAGVGASATVNTLANKVKSEISGNTSVIGLGYTGVAHAGAFHYGVTVAADATSTIDMVTANGAVGGVAGVAALFSFNLIDDSARVVVGETGEGTLVRINPDATGLASALGSETAAPIQDTQLLASTSSDVTAITANVAIGGKAGVGAGSGNVLVTSLADVAVNEAIVEARDDVTLDSTAVTALETVTLGLAGGFVGVAANASVNRIGAQALITLDGATLEAGDDLTLETLVDSDSIGTTGAAAGGAVGATGGVQVTLYDSTSKISSGTGESSRTGGMTSGGRMLLEAETDLFANGNAVTGAIGGGALALAANISLIEAETTVEIGANQVLTAQEALTLRATDRALIQTVTGSIGAGALGAGASLDYVNFAGTTQVLVGQDARIEADPGNTGLSQPLNSTRNLTIEALSQRDVDSAVVAIGAGGISFSGAVSIIEMGALAEDEEDKRGEFLADAQGELDAGQDGDSGKTGDEKKSTAGHLVTMAGGADSQSRIVASRQSIDLEDAPGEDVVKVQIATGAELLSRGSVDVKAEASTAIKQLAGGGSASIFGGATSGVAIANLGTGTTIEIGSGVDISADGRVRLSAENGEIDGRNIIDSQAATVAASAGYSAGVGVSVATLSGRSAVSVGRGSSLGGLTRTNAADIDLSAQRSGTVATDTYNLSVNLVGGVGVAVSHAMNEGVSAIDLGTGAGAAKVAVRGTTVDLATGDDSRVVATGEGSSGGIAGAVNSVTITAEGQSTGLLTTVNADISGNTVTLANESAATAHAEARGISIGAVAIGAAVATAEMNFTLDTDVAGTFNADTLNLRTRITRDTFDHAKAVSASTSGGLLAGNGAVAQAFSHYAVSADYAGTFTAGTLLDIDTSASQVTTDAHSTGRSGGAVAVGLTISRAGQDMTAPEDERRASVATAINGATLDAGEVDISTSNAPSARATSDSGSGGLVSGSGAETYVMLDTETATTLGDTGSVTVTADTLRLSTGQSATVGSKVNTVSAAAVGKSGALTDTDVTTAVTTRIGGMAVLRADTFDLSANNAVARPQDGFNITSGSGGALDIPAMQSTVNVSATTDMMVDGGARLTQTGLLGNNQTFQIGTYTDMALTDRQKLDAGGAIAIPIGNSRVTVDKNDATVTIGAAEIFSIEDVTLYSGGDAALKAEVDSTSYGLAGAATGQSYATYNADNRVAIGDGARIEAMNDIRIQSGYGARQAQSVTVDAETRVFNKTAVPIPTDPVADAAAHTASIVDVQEGAQVIAVRDVYLLAEEGSRDITGYGRGKDLYREVLAEIGSEISEAFGGEPVSLDIESGTSTNTSDDGILVDGYVRAGSRNRQILILDENNQLDNAGVGLGYTDEMAEGIEYEIREDVLLTSEIQERIDLLEALIADPILSRDAAAVVAWEAERDLLVARALTVSGTADFIDLEDIVASEGNIILRADYVHGTDFTGTLDAPGNAEIIVYAFSDAFINTKAMIIPENAGGRITFNDVVVTTPADIAALSDPLRPGPSEYNMISGDQAGEPLIETVTYGDGSIIIGGNIYNPDGIARFNSNFGDLDVRADVSAKTVQLSAGRDFIQGFTLGFTEVDGDPREIYESYFDDVEDLTRRLIFAGFGISAAEGEDIIVDLGSITIDVGDMPDFQLAPRRGQIRAGRNVYITADKLNINGLIQAGTGSYDVVIGAGIDADIAGLSKTGTTVLYNPAEPVNDKVIRNPNITSDVFIEYDPTGTDADGNITGKIVVSPMVVQGGIVELTGEVFSTGGGEIRSLDGYGRINVVSESAIPIELGRIDAGELGEAGQGLEGVVRITDTSRTTGAGDFLITEFRRVGSQFRQLDNETFDTLEIDFDNDGATDATRILPTNLVAASTSNGGRSGEYQTRENIDLVINRSETVSQTRTSTQTDFYFWAPLSESVESKSGPVINKDLPAEVAPGLNGVYLADRDPAATYAYHFEGQRFGYTSVETSRTTDDKRVLGIGDVVTTWTTVQSATHLYTHRLKADYGVKITFDGADTGGLSVIGAGDIELAGAVNNQVGHSTISSLGGSVVTSDASVQLTLGDLDVSAFGGRIDGLSTAFRVDQSAGSVLNAIARDEINIRELDGDMIVGEVRTTDRTAASGADINGQVRLQAEGSILAENASSLVTGASIDLRSTDGGIGTDSQSLRIHEDGAALTARARNDVFIEETVGDLNLRTVTSDTGSVELVANDGAILDRNDIELRDARTESELAELWLNQLQLDDPDASGRRQAQIDALKAERRRSYDEYWAARTADGDAPQSFTLDPAIAQSLLDGGWSQAQLDAYIAEREALYAAWNGEATFDPDYDYAPSPEEQLAVTEGIEWSEQELNEWVRAGLIRGTGDTNVRIEDPNVSAAGDITLIARDAVGEFLPDFVLGTDRAENLRVLSTAERADVTIDETTGTVTVRQAEDVNFAFTRIDTEGRALGNLRVQSAGADIFLAAETAASIADITTTADISIRTDGWITDNRDGTAALNGSAIIVESGNDAPIGTADDPLTVNVAAGGSLIARSGQEVNIHAIGDLPLQEIFSGGRAQITAAGAITDDAATGAVRVRAADLLISGSSVGASGAPLVIEITDSEAGALDLEATTGDAFVSAEGGLRLSRAEIAGGGEITTTASLSLIGDDTISFGSTAALDLLAMAGIEVTDATGTDVTGGALTLSSNGPVAGEGKRLATAIASLSIGPADPLAPPAESPVFIEEADDLAILSVTQAHEDADTDIIAGGTVSIGTVSSGAEFRLDAGAITEGRIEAERTELVADGGIGGTTPLDVTTGRLFASTVDGSIDIGLRDRATEVEQITAGGAGEITLRATDAPLTLLEGPGITTEGGALTADVTSLTARANILSNGGVITLETLGDFNQSAGTRLDAGAGTVLIDVGGAMQVAQVATTNATADALRLTVTGALSVAPGQGATQLVANEAGAVTTLRLGALVPTGPNGLEVALAELDAVIDSGDTHLNEADGIILSSVVGTGGLIDIFTGGDTVVEYLEGAAAAPLIVSSSGGSILGDGATLSGGDVRLFAFGGALAGVTGDTFTGDTVAGTTLHLLSRDDLRYTETAGDLRVGFALSDAGDLVLSAPDGAMELGVLGADGVLSLAAEDRLTVNIIGRATVDLADEVGLQLVAPEFYGLREARSPDTLSLTAFNPGSEIYAGLVNAKQNIGLFGDILDVHLYDATAADGMDLVITDADGDFAEFVDVQSIGDGPVLFMSDFFDDVRPRTAGRDRSEGWLTLSHGRIGTGQLTHAGPAMIGQDVVINGDVWFRQRSFDMLAQITYDRLSTVADVQVLAINDGAMTFGMSNEIILVTHDPTSPLDGSGGSVLVLNRRLGGVDLNGGQGFAFGVGVDTDILAFPFTFRGTAPGVTHNETLRQIDEQTDSEGFVLPGFVTGDSGEDGALCVVRYSQEPCMELSLNLGSE